MNIDRTVCSQLMAHLPWTTCDRIMERYAGNYRFRTLACREHFWAMAFTQLPYRVSLRDIDTCLGTKPSTLFRMVLSSPVRSSTLSDANELSDWRIYSEDAQVLIGQARKLHASQPGVLDVKGTVHDLESGGGHPLCLSEAPRGEIHHRPRGST